MEYQVDRLIGWAKSVPVLILDDLGKTHSRDSSWIEERLYLIVDHRYNERLPIVVTSEFTGKGLVGHGGRECRLRLEHDALITGLRLPAKPWRSPMAVTS